jgi:hypothetical protein
MLAGRTRVREAHLRCPCPAESDLVSAASTSAPAKAAYTVSNPLSSRSQPRRRTRSSACTAGTCRAPTSDRLYCIFFPGARCIYIHFFAKEQCCIHSSPNKLAPDNICITLTSSSAFASMAEGRLKSPRLSRLRSSHRCIPFGRDTHTSSSAAWVVAPPEASTRGASCLRLD